jgi:peroxiredoxin
LPSTIETLGRQLGNQGLQIWAVNLQEPRERVAAWVRERGLTVRVLLDANGTAARAYQVRGTPTVVLVDRGGRLVARGVGARPWAGDKGLALLRALLGAAP